MPQVHIVEQPASKALRFRYACEGRFAGSIPGVSSKKGHPTFPTIKVVDCPGRKGIVVVSCVTADPPYRPHPYNLVGREGCKRGICVMDVPPDTMMVTFSNLGIQCVKKKDIAPSLALRQTLKVDPFRTGFQERTTYDLNSVRLCFQVFLENKTSPGTFNIGLPPKVSNPVYDKKCKSDLIITRLSDCACPPDGGRKDMILLCEKVVKEDIQIQFVEEVDGYVAWEDHAVVRPQQVHKQHAIWFRPPRYRDLGITDVVEVKIQLRRPSDGATSDPLPFQYVPMTTVKRKRPLDYGDLGLRDCNMYAGSNYTPHYNILSPQQSPGPQIFHNALNDLYTNRQNWNEHLFYGNNLAGPSGAQPNWGQEQNIEPFIGLECINPDFNSLPDVVSELVKIEK